MARPRRVPGPSAQAKADKSSSGGSSGSSPVRVAPRSTLLSWRGAVGVVCLAVAVFYTVRGYLETRVNTPFDNEKVVTKSGLDVPERFWGTYRPGNYLGIRARTPRSPLFGLMWYDQTRLLRNQAGIRHWCSQDDNLKTYGWLRHDGVSFGEQILWDSPDILTTEFVKSRGSNGGGWSVRVTVKPENASRASGPVSVVWYAALEDPGAEGATVRLTGHVISGHAPPLSYRVQPLAADGSEVSWSSGEGRAAGAHLLKEKLIEMLRVAQGGRGDTREIVLVSDPEMQGLEANFVAVQATGRPPFSVEFVYETEGTLALKGDALTAALEAKKKEFDARFEYTFHLEKKGYSSEEVAAARAALSNMVGGVGYMYGASRVSSVYTEAPVPYWRAALYTAVPSRSFFPRGFLWDEGFHGLLIGRWSPEIAIDIAAHWLDLVNVEGWIPREQILGVEAAARVPKEFIVQSNAAANPPMLLVTLGRLVESLARHPLSPGAHRDTMLRALPRLQAWYQWFHTTQRGLDATSYRWRGREDSGTELNPKTLTSGLDDYPRASHPSEVERHVDLRCWMYAAADAMVKIAGALDRDTTKYEAMRDLLGDEELLNELHWSEERGMYADYGLHTDSVRLARAQRQPGAPPAQHPPPLLRVTSAPPREQLVTSAYGYVSLFPMLLQVLPPGSAKLCRMLQHLDDPDHLWSPYGLRSLSKSSPLYMKRNTEHDPPYWRGQVWLNINYLAVSSLRHYAASGAPCAERAATLHRELRKNLVDTVLKEYNRTGYFWEQYSDSTGAGSGCRPFTGWTALVVLMMSDEY